MDYSTIVNIFINELESSSLRELEPDFYSKALRYVKGLESAKGHEYEARVIRKTLEKLLVLRLEKIIRQLWRTGERPEVGIAKEEAEILSMIEETLATLKGKGKHIEEEKIVHKQTEEEGVLVYFLKPYSRIMLSEGMMLGPFSQGDIAFLPSEVAKELKEKGVVRVI